VYGQHINPYRIKSKSIIFDVRITENFNKMCGAVTLCLLTAALSKAADPTFLALGFGDFFALIYSLENRHDREYLATHLVDSTNRTRRKSFSAADRNSNQLHCFCLLRFIVQLFQLETDLAIHLIQEQLIKICEF
jgi:hypothetical protein